MVPQEHKRESPSIQAPDENGQGHHCGKTRYGGPGRNTEEHPEAGWSWKGGRAVKYAVVFEKGPNSYGAYVPDLPGCVAVGDTLEEVERLIQEAIEFHIEGMREDGDPIPEPTSTVKEIEVFA